MADQSLTDSPFALLLSCVARLELLLRPGKKLEQREPDGEPDGEPSAILHRMHRILDQVSFMYDAAHYMAQNLPVRDVLTLLMEAICRRPYRFVVLLLGESELGPYIYRELRGVEDPLRYLGKQCPLPLWGELAHALVRRLDLQEPDYVIITDLAHSDRPRPQEFPWLQRQGSLMIVPLRKDQVAMGAILLGRTSVDGFDDSELRTEVLEMARIAAIPIHNAQVRQELQDRADQLVGLQLFTRSLPLSGSLFDLLVAAAMGVADLLVNSDVFVIMLREHCPPRLLQQTSPYVLRLPWDDLYIIGRWTQPSAELMNDFLHRLIIWTIEAGQPLFLNPQQEYPTLEELYYNETGHALLAPLSSGDNPLGALFAVSRDPLRHFNENDMVVTRTMANIVAGLIEAQFRKGLRG